jgi:hypothetical protein
MIILWIILMVITWGMGIKRGHGTMGFFMALLAPIGTIILLIMYPKKLET